MFDVLRCIASIDCDDGSREEILSIAIHNLAFHPQSRRKRFSPNSDPSLLMEFFAHQCQGRRTESACQCQDRLAREKRREEKLREKFVKQTHEHMERARGEKLSFAVRRRRANGAAICVYTTTHDHVHGFLVEEKTGEFRGLVRSYSRDDVR